MLLEILTYILILVIVGIPIFFLLRKLKNEQDKKDIKYNIKTKFGTRIMLSPQTNNINKLTFERWTNELIDFWVNAISLDEKECYKRISVLKIKIYDENKIYRYKKFVNGLAWIGSNLIEITSFPPDNIIASINRVKSLFRHEVSHMLCYYVGKIPSGPNSGETHHKLFKDVKLGD